MSAGLQFSPREEARSVVDFLRLSQQHPRAAKRLLYDESVEIWLASIGQGELAELARTIRRTQRTKIRGLEAIREVMLIRLPAPEKTVLDRLPDLIKVVGIAATIGGALALVLGWHYTRRYFSNFGIALGLLEWESSQYSLQAIWPMMHNICQAGFVAFVAYLDLLVGKRKPVCRLALWIGAFLVLLLVCYGFVLRQTGARLLAAVVARGTLPWYIGAALLAWTHDKSREWKVLVCYPIASLMFLFSLLYNTDQIATVRAQLDMESFKTSALPEITLFSERELVVGGPSSSASNRLSSSELRCVPNFRYAGLWLVTVARETYYVLPIPDPVKRPAPRIYAVRAADVCGIELRPPHVRLPAPGDVGAPLATPVPTPTAE